MHNKEFGGLIFQRLKSHYKILRWTKTKQFRELIFLTIKDKKKIHNQKVIVKMRNLKICVERLKCNRKLNGKNTL